MLATRGDVEARLARSLTQTEQQQAEGMLAEAEALVIGYLGADPTDPRAVPQVPAPVTVVVSRMVARVIDRAATMGQAATAQSVTLNAGPFGRTLNFGATQTAGGPWLAATDKVTLRPYRRGHGLTSMTASSGRTGRYRSTR